MNSDSFDAASLAGAAALGAVAGLRSMTAPALLSQAARTGSIDLESTPFQFLSTQRAADIATAAAVLELVADKLPFTPDRTGVPGLAARIASGAMVGAALSSARKKDWVPGAIVGAAAAVAGTFIGFWLRKTLTESGAPDLPIALAEDTVAVAVGVLALRYEAGQSSTIAVL